MSLYEVVQGLGELSDEELRRLTSAIRCEEEFREHRRELDQLQFSEDGDGQKHFENELIRTYRRG
jgi:hypothetical protein